MGGFLEERMNQLEIENLMLKDEVRRLREVLSCHFDSKVLNDLVVERIQLEHLKELVVECDGVQS